MKKFEKNVINLYGKKGRQWLELLPNLVIESANIYGLSNLRPVSNLSYNYVLSGFQGPQPIILKLGLDVDGCKRESASLIAFKEFGAVQIFSEDNGLLLLESADPGVSLKSYFPAKDDEAINISANVIKRLHKAPIPNSYEFPHIKDWLTTLDNNIKIPYEYLQKARHIRDQLLKNAAPDVLLHGDLHHDNILQHGKNWLVIDPKGVIGESAYEVAAFIRNPCAELVNHTDALNIIHNRISRFAELLELSERRISDWCFVQAVLAWVWTLEDSCDDYYFKKLTEFFEKLTYI